MVRWRALLAVVVVMGCARSRPKTVPATTADPDLSAAVPSSDSAAAPLSPAPTISTADAALDSTFLRRQAADSAKDAAMLDRLRDAKPPASVEERAEATPDRELGPTFDINVAAYTEHERVRYWLDFFQGPARERMDIWLTRLPTYEPMIRTALAANGLPGDLVYLGLIESGFSNTAVSRSRAVGMWQFMRPTAKDFGLRVDRWVDERRDPIKATRAAARYLAQLTARFGSHYLAAAAYNGGPGTVARGLSRMDPDEEEADDDSLGTARDAAFFQLSDTRYLRRETKDYIPKLIAAAMIAKQPERYGFAPIPVVDPYAVDSVTVPDATSLEVIAKLAGIGLTDVVELNPHYLRLITPPGRSAVIRVPRGYGAGLDSTLVGMPPSDLLPSVTHVVRAGETWAAVGRRYGVSTAELVRRNPDLNPKRLRPGESVTVPGTALVRRWAADDSREASGGSSRAGRGVHIVERGETIGGIARHYRVSVDLLREWNDLGTSGTVRAGQRLRVSGVRRETATATRSPAPKPGRATRAPVVVHIVRAGDTLAGLARRYGVSVQSLMNANRLRSARGLQVGKRLTIPS